MKPATEPTEFAQSRVEHVDTRDHLLVPVASSWDDYPRREGWQPFWVNVNLNGHATWQGEPKMIVTYKRVSDGC